MQSAFFDTLSGVPAAWCAAAAPSCSDAERLVRAQATPGALQEGLTQLWFSPNETRSGGFVAVTQSRAGGLAHVSGESLDAALEERSAQRTACLARWLKAGLDPNTDVLLFRASENTKNEVPLLALALEANDVPCVALLLAHGADPNRTHGTDSTPVSVHALPPVAATSLMSGGGILPTATLMKRGQLMVLLMVHGADPGSEDATGDSLLARARHHLPLLPYVLAELEAAHLNHALVRPMGRRSIRHRM